MKIRLDGFKRIAVLVALTQTLAAAFAATQDVNELASACVELADADAVLWSPACALGDNCMPEAHAINVPDVAAVRSSVAGVLVRAERDPGFFTTTVTSGGGIFYWPTPFEATEQACSGRRLQVVEARADAAVDEIARFVSDADAYYNAIERAMTAIDDNMGELFDQGVMVSDKLDALAAQIESSELEWADNAVGKVCQLTGDNGAHYERDYCRCAILYDTLEHMKVERAHLQRILDDTFPMKAAANVNARQALWDMHLDHTVRDSGDPLHPIVPTPPILEVESALQQLGCPGTDPFTYAPAFAHLGSPSMPGPEEKLGGLSLVEALRSVSGALQEQCTRPAK